MVHDVLQMAPDASIIPPSDFIQVQPLVPDKTSDESSLAATARQESEGGGELEDDLKKDPRIVAGLLDVVCILWMTNGRNLAKPENKDYRTVLEKRSKPMLHYLFKYYKSSDICRNLVYLSSWLPHSSSQTTAGFCLSQLRVHAAAAVAGLPSNSFFSVIFL